jgi:hypothetical protein
MAPLLGMERAMILIDKRFWAGLAVGVIASSAFVQFVVVPFLRGVL